MYELARALHWQSLRRRHAGESMRAARELARACGAYKSAPAGAGDRFSLPRPAVCACACPAIWVKDAPGANFSFTTSPFTFPARAARSRVCLKRARAPLASLSSSSFPARDASCFTRVRGSSRSITDMRVHACVWVGEVGRYGRMLSRCTFAATYQYCGIRGVG